MKKQKPRKSPAKKTVKPQPKPKPASESEKAPLDPIHAALARRRLSMLSH